MNKQNWSVSLKSFTQAQREQTPIPLRNSLSEEEEWQCRIIGGDFLGWCQHHFRDILQQRMALRIGDFDPNPIIVFTTTMPGLVAAQEIMPEPSENLVYLLHSEFKKWEKKHLVADFKFHIHHWSYFRPIDQEILTRAQEVFPEVKAAEYRIHTSGELWGKHCGVEDEHLWRWNGQQLELLEESFSQVQF
jgi:hypothetical protein